MPSTLATTQVGAGSVAPRPAMTRYLVFLLAGESFALPLADVREIVPLPLLSRPPGLPSLLAGFLNLQGQAVAVLRLDRLFGLPEMTPGLYTPLVVLRDADPPLALMPEEVVGIATARDDEVLPMPPDASFNDCAAGMFTFGGQDGTNVVLLATRRILSEKEQQCLAEFEALEQARLEELTAVQP